MLLGKSGGELIAPERMKWLGLSVNDALLWMCPVSLRAAKTLKEIGIPDHFNCLLRNLYAGQEATVRTQYVTTD